jgi:hypothetical protein
MSYDEIHFGGARAIGSGGLEFKDDKDDKDDDDDPKTLSEAFDVKDVKITDLHKSVSITEPISTEDVTLVAQQFKKWLIANGVKDDDIQRVLKV